MGLPSIAAATEWVDCLVAGVIEHGPRTFAAEEGDAWSRDSDTEYRDGRLSFVRGSERLAAMRGVPVGNARSGAPKPLSPDSSCTLRREPCVAATQQRRARPQQLVA